jgi:hypothetical protein
MIESDLFPPTSFPETSGASFPWRFRPHVLVLHIEGDFERHEDTRRAARSRGPE